MIFIKDKLTYEEVRSRFEKEGYKLLSTEYKNAKSNLNVMCPKGHEWTTNMSNFGSGRRCSVCGRKKKYSLYQVINIFAVEGYKVLDSIYINGKVPIKVICPYGHETEICLNNFLSGKRCGRCRRWNDSQERMKKLELRAKINLIPLWETSGRFFETNDCRNKDMLDKWTEEEWLIKLESMKRNLKLAKRRTYRDNIYHGIRQFNIHSDQI